MAAVDPWVSWGESRACVPIGHIGCHVVASPSSDLPLPWITASEPGGFLGQGGSGPPLSLCRAGTRRDQNTPLGDKMM